MSAASPRVSLRRLRSVFATPPVSRFAPAPTGRLHLGHVLNAIYVWGITRALGGRVLLRIEDHDRRRCRREFEREILDDLAWLGFESDEPAVYQRDRDPVYSGALARPRHLGLTYACDCSRAAIAAAAGAAGDEVRYPGTCSGKGLDEKSGRGVRVRLVRDAVAFDDLRHGPLVQRPSEQCGDLLVRDRDGHWTYQFAVTVDDWQQGVTLVIRGDDLLASTGRQIALARMLGRAEPPRFLHHPLVMKTARQKLSKSDGDTAISALRAAGVPAPEIIGRAARAGGLVDHTRPISAADAPSLVTMP